MLIRIEANHFVAGVDTLAVYGKDNKKINRCAPIVKYMKFWGRLDIFSYCHKKDGKYNI